MADRLGHGVKTVVASRNAFTAVLKNGTLAIWGNVHKYENPVDLMYSIRHVQTVVANENAFAVLYNNGNVTSYGQVKFGGNFSMWATAWSPLTTSCYWEAPPTFSQLGCSPGCDFGPFAAQKNSQGISVAEIVANSGAFCAIYSDGSVGCWGKPSSGGGSTTCTVAALKNAFYNGGPVILKVVANK